MSAACWCAIADQEDSASAQRAMPIDRAATAIATAAPNAPLDVLGLGCGDAKHEVRLLQHLLDQNKPSPTEPLLGPSESRLSQADLRLFLLDISQPLLSVAFQHAKDTLARRPGVPICALQGNFHHLPQYPHLLADPQRPHRRRLVCLFGDTFANLDNELMFIRHSLVGLTGGDLLLINTSLTAAPVDRRDDIHRLDPRLSGRLPPGWQQRYDEWLTGPIQRYGKDVAGVEFSSVLDTASCPVPGSYAVETRAHLRSSTGSQRVFTLLRCKRHDALKLVQPARTGLGAGGRLALRRRARRSPAVPVPPAGRLRGSLGNGTPKPA